MADLAHDASGPASSEPASIATQQTGRPVSSEDRGKLRVFISYSRDDLDFADQLDAALNAYGFECLIDRHGISGGEDWKRRLGNLISEADTVVFVLSPSSAGSPICVWELKQAADAQRRRARIRNIALVVVSVLAALAGWLGWNAEQQRVTAEEQKTRAEQQQKIAEEQRQQADKILARATNIIGNLQFQMDSETKRQTFALFQAGAEHGDATAMWNLGVTYQEGFGVPQDYAKAREWFEKGAAHGEARAKMALERLPSREAEKAGRYDEALRLREASAAKLEAEETKRDGKPGDQTARVLTGVTWLALFAKEFTKAFTVAERAHALFPNNLSIETNRAHALMFMEHGEEAKALYLAYKGQRMSGEDDRLWERVIAQDFAEFRKAGLTNPMMADVEKELGISR
jgi:hypothetical protein